MLNGDTSRIRRYAQKFMGRRPLLLVPILLGIAAIITWQIAFAQAPAPNPLTPITAGGNPIFAPVPGADITANGPAASIHGEPYRGRLLFALNCTTCHGDRGTAGILNPGSDDGSVPLLNPIDPGFLEDIKNSPEAAAAFAKEIDLFIQHGSRPAGDDPLYSMVGWGDHKLLNQQQIADLEAYVMQLNGVYWGDRYYPPAEVRMQAVSDSKVVTYTVTLVNHGGSPLGDITLRDTLPPGLFVIKSALLGFDQRSDPSDPSDQGNNGQVDGTTVKFVGTPNVPVGGTLGPFIIVAGISDYRKPVLPNVAELLFSFTTFDGNTYMTSAVSDRIAPAAPKGITQVGPALPGASPTPAATAATAAAATPTTAPTSAATTAPTAVATSAPPFATPTPIPSPTPAGGSVRILQPQPDALAWIFDPQTITVGVGSNVTWTNAGSLVHTVTADDGSFDSGNLNIGDTWSLTFNQPGTYAYHCTPHPWMKGTVVVK